MSEQIINPNEMENMEAEGQSSVQRCLTFNVDELTVFLSTDYVIEILNDQSITSLPMVPAFVKGVINVRGQILPIVDVRSCMGKPEIEYTSQTCIIILHIDSIPLGIVVDSVKQVVDIDMQNVRPIPVKRQQKLLNGMITMEDGSTVMSFDCHALADCRY